MKFLVLSALIGMLVFSGCSVGELTPVEKHVLLLSRNISYSNDLGPGWRTYEEVCQARKGVCRDIVLYCMGQLRDEGIESQFVDLTGQNHCLLLVQGVFLDPTNSDYSFKPDPPRPGTYTLWTFSELNNWALQEDNLQAAQAAWLKGEWHE